MQDDVKAVELSLELLPREARNRQGQRARLWTTAGLERQLLLRGRA